MTIKLATSADWRWLKGSAKHRTDFRDATRVAIWNAAQPPLSDATGLAANALDAEAVKLTRRCVQIAREMGWGR